MSSQSHSRAPKNGQPNGQGAGVRVLLAGGGSGGHVFPALAVADELVDRGCVVSWIGRSEGMERDLVETRGLQYDAIEARPWVGRGSLDKLSALMTLSWSALKARRLVKALGAAVTVGTGGYVSAPAILGSYLARRPVLLLEPNATAGAANRLLSRLSTVACTGYEETGRELKCRSYWTGTPVRSEFFLVPEIGDAPTLLVVGGSQGAQQINELMPPILERLASRIRGLEVLHQTGTRNLASVEAGYRSRDLGRTLIEVVPFIEDMAAAMTKAAVIVSRAGALTLAEITAAGRPSVLIPLSAAAGHQRANAEQLKAAGAAEVVGPEQANVDDLGSVLGDLLMDQERRRQMALAARRLARVDAAGRIADFVEVLGRAA